MSIRRFTGPQLNNYITALHEAAHAVVAHKSEHWKINDPAVTFPHLSTGHLARAHFGPKVPRSKLTKAHVREFVKIGYAGLHGQNLIDEHMLLSVLSSPTAGCEDDFSAAEQQAKAAGIEDEVVDLIQQSYDLVNENAKTVFALANLIYNATSDVSSNELLKILNSAPTKPSPERLFVWHKILRRLKSLFTRNRRT